MSKTFKSLALACIAMFAGIMSYAQVTTSALSGKITDAKGTPLEGVAIVANHTPSGTVYGAITNSEGRYTIQGMRNGGPYTVEVSCLGYQSVVYNDITLQLAETYNLDSKIQESSEFLDEVVVVATPTSKFAAQEKTGASTNISNENILAMPSVNRSVSDMAKLSPYGGSGMSFAGMDGRSANFTIDGANFNNNFGLSDGLPGGGNPVSLDAIDEIQVVVSPYDVRQSNFIGGGINAVTKSGTNKFKGTAYVYHQNEELHGNRALRKELGDRQESRVTTYGFTLGGPIIKNKLFFFVNYEMTQAPGVVNRWRPSTDGKWDTDKYISRTTVADMEMISKFAKEHYLYDTGSWTDYPGDESNMKVLARIDWNINEKNRLAVRYNYTLNKSWKNTNGSSMNGGQRMSNNRLSQYSMAFANSMYSMDNLVHSVSVDLNSRITNDLSNQFLATFSKLDDIRGSNSAKFPFVDILKPYTDDAGNVSLEPYMSLGYELFTWNNGVHNNVLNIKDDVTWYKGDHKIMGGVSYEYQMADNAYMREGTGYYRYSSMEDFMSGAAPETVAITYGYDGEQNPAARVRFSQVGLYGMDEWNATERLKLTAGIRFDTMIYNNADVMTNNAIKAVDFGGRTIDTGRWPATNIQISPRVGFVYDVFGNKSLKVRGGTGLFAGRLSLVFLTNMPTNSGMVQNAAAGFGTYYKSDWTVDNRDPGLDQLKGDMITDVDKLVEKLHSIYPDKFPYSITPEDGILPSDVNYVDHKFKMPQIWKSSIAVDWNLPVGFPLTLTGEFIYSKKINDLLIQDWNIKDNNGWAQYNGADNRHIYPENFKYTGTNAYVLTNTHKGYGWTGVISLMAQPVQGLNITASYTRTVNKEVTGMPGSAANSVFTGLPTVDGPNFATVQNSQYTTPNRIMASINWNDKSNNHFTIFYQGYNAGGYSYMYNGDFNGDGNANDLMYIPTDAQINDGSFRFASQTDRDNYMAFAAQDAYLSTHKGQYAEAYSVFSPLVHKFDFRYAHDFILNVGKTKHTLQLNMDWMNIGNFFNSSWGLSRTWDDSAMSGRILQMDSVDADGVPVFKTRVKAGAKTWKPNAVFTQCWYMQVGIKYMFN